MNAPHPAATRPRRSLGPVAYALCVLLILVLVKWALVVTLAADSAPARRGTLGPLGMEATAWLFGEEEPWRSPAAWGTYLPFLALIAALSVNRLRNAGQTAWWAGLLFVPWANLLLVLVLSILPAASRDTEDQALSRFGAWLPQGAAAAGLTGILLVAGMTCLLAAFVTEFFAYYGYLLFVALPFVAGFCASLLLGLRGLRPGWQHLAAAVWSLAFAALGLLVLGLEGVVCLVMAAPLGIALALAGAATARQTLFERSPRVADPRSLAVLLLIFPGIAILDAADPGAAPLHRVTTPVEIAAPREIVWRHVVSFAELPPPTDWLFSTGIAYPIRADIEGEGPGAVRHCVFSTGPFVEPIEVWDEPSLLRFSVTENPPPMEETNPFHEVYPAHLEGFMVSERGQFLLIELPDGGTRLEGTTWYRHGLEPASYWKLWSDFIIHRIHRRVLEHIRNLAEEELVRVGGSLAAP